MVQNLIVHFKIAMLEVYPHFQKHPLAAVLIADVDGWFISLKYAKQKRVPRESFKTLILDGDLDSLA